MNKKFWILAFASTVSSATWAEDAPKSTVYACDYNFQDPRREWGQASVETVQNVLQKFSFTNLLPDPRGGQYGYSCTFENARSNTKTEKWESSGATLKITDHDTDPAGVVKITRMKSGFRIDLSKSSAADCGQAAEPPVFVFISFSSKRCLVKHFHGRK
jgi:hypothetical protein